jgi:hypothetical protein
MEYAHKIAYCDPGGMCDHASAILLAFPDAFRTVRSSLKDKDRLSLVVMLLFESEISSHRKAEFFTGGYLFVLTAEKKGSESMRHKLHFYSVSALTVENQFFVFGCTM